MLRHLLVPALFAVALVPIAATAQYPCVCPPVYLPPCPPSGVVIVSGTVAGCAPTTGTVVPPKPPTVIPERMEQPKKPEVKAEPMKEIPAKAEEVETPKLGDPVFKPVDPTPAPMKPADPLPPVNIDPKPPERLVVPPTRTEPKVVPPTPRNDTIPAPAVPPTPPAKPGLGKMDFEVPPVGDPPPAKPQPAEGTPAEPAKHKAPEKMNKLPDFNFDLPKVDNAQPVEANKKTVANSSPVADRTQVDVYPRDGKDVVSASRGVTFVNKSDRDILLTVDGKTTTLPSKTVLTADVPAAFKWQIGGGPERSEKVPDGSPGVDVVIRK